MDKIQDPTTGKWVNVNGAAGKRILNNYVKYNQKTIVRNPQYGGGTFNKIQNPKTGNWVNINGPIGRKVLQNYVRQVGGSAEDELLKQLKGTGYGYLPQGVHNKFITWPMHFLLLIVFFTLLKKLPIDFSKLTCFLVSLF